MSDHSHLARRHIAEQAAHWLLTLQDEDLSMVQRTEFVDWLRQSPLHVSELLRSCQVQRQLSNLSDWHELMAAEESTATNIVSLRQVQPTSARLPGAHHRNGWIAVAGALVAVVVVMAIGAVWLFGSQNRIELRTAAGERREVTLSDGSEVDLSPRSAVLVHYEHDQRLLTLEEGRALFHVAKNPNRPFIVQVATTRVRAVGTVFDVERRGDGVLVAVVEGRVAISQLPPTPRLNARDRPSAPVVSLSENERISIDEVGVASAVGKVNAVADADQSELMFDNETVADISRRFNSHNTLKIDVVDPVLAARRVSGAFHIDDPQSFVSFLQAAAAAPVSRAGSDRIVVGVPESSR
jgi:transmembrane sensor